MLRYTPHECSLPELAIDEIYYPTDAEDLAAAFRALNGSELPGDQENPEVQRHLQTFEEARRKYRQEMTECCIPNRLGESK